MEESKRERGKKGKEREKKSVKKKRIENWYIIKVPHLRQK